MIYFKCSNPQIKRDIKSKGEAGTTGREIVYPGELRKLENGLFNNQKSRTLMT